MTDPPGEDLEGSPGCQPEISSRSWNKTSLWRNQPREAELKATSACPALPAARLRSGRPQLLLAAVGAEERHLPFSASAGPFFCAAALLAHVSRLSSARLTHAANCSPSARSFS